MNYTMLQVRQWERDKVVVEVPDIGVVNVWVCMGKQRDWRTEQGRPLNWFKMGRCAEL